MRLSNWPVRRFAGPFRKPIARAALQVAVAITVDPNTGRTSMSVTAAHRAKPLAITYPKHSTYRYARVCKLGAAFRKIFGAWHRSIGRESSQFGKNGLLQQALARSVSSLPHRRATAVYPAFHRPGLRPL